MHHVGRIDWSFADQPAAASATSSGLARPVLVGREQGAVHTELAVGGARARRLAAPPRPLVRGGAVRPRRASSPSRSAASSHRLVAGDFALIPIGTWHALAQRAATSQVRWLSVNTPQRLAPDAGRKDTFFTRAPFDAAELVARAVRPRFGDPAVRLVGHYDGTPPQAEALRVDDPARGRKPAGHGHGAARLQRDLREDARRPGVRRRPADDVHGRLRDRRLGAAARPPVRGDLRVPRRRGRGRARRHGLHAAARATSCSPASAACTASTTPGPSGSAGSRPRRRNRRSATPIAGRRRGRKFEEDNDVG